MASKPAEAPVSGLFAFWVDGSTYLGGAITRINEEGRVYVPSYQAWLQPVFITTEEAGKKTLDKLKAVEAAYSLKRKNLHDEYLEAVKEAAVWVGKVPS